MFPLHRLGCDHKRLFSILTLTRYVTPLFRLDSLAQLLRSLSRSRSREPRAGSGKNSPQNRSQSRPRVSESSKLAQVDEHTRSSLEDDASTTHTHTQTAHKHSGLVDKIASHLPGHNHTTHHD